MLNIKRKRRIKIRRISKMGRIAIGKITEITEIIEETVKTMLTIEIKFEANRYNATPWMNNVNENIPEWPPSIYRLFRAMIDSWKRKYDYIPEDKIISIFDKLSKTKPSFKIPEYTSSYTVSYMNVKDNKIIPNNQSALIYNPFVYIVEPLYIIFNTDIGEEDKNILSKILSGINYLGRSESWVSISIIDKNIEPNCKPDENGDYYVSVPKEIKDSKILSSIEKTTKDLQKSNIPEEMEIERYSLNSDSFSANRRNQKTGKTSIKSVLYEINSVSLPMIYNTVMLSEKIHRSLLSAGERMYHAVPEKFSGRAVDGTLLKGHRHLYIMPLDVDNDGKLDHVLLKGKENLSANELNIINNVKFIYQKEGKIQLTPIQYYSNNEDIEILFHPSKYWISETPIMFSRHYKKNKGLYSEWLKNEVIKELKFHYVIKDDSDIENIEMINHINKHGRNYYWLNFKRSRKQNEPEKFGYGFKITFKNNVGGPFCAGYSAHFGLGMFLPARDYGE